MDSQQISKDTPAYASALGSDILMRDTTADFPYIGIIDNQTVAYLDWLGDIDKLQLWLNTYWPTQTVLPADGYLLQNNWMLDQSVGIQKHPELRYFPIIPDDLAVRMTNLTRWSIRHATTDTPLFYSLNKVGTVNTEAVKKHIPTDKLLISSSFTIHQPSAVILQNFNGTWTNLRQQVQKIVVGGMAGINWMGASVCGDIVTGEDSDYTQVAEINEELCVRWYQFASLTAIFRVRTDRIPTKFSRHVRLIMTEVIQRCVYKVFLKNIIQNVCLT